MKVQVKRAFKSQFFVTKKAIKKQTGWTRNFLQPPIPVCRSTYLPYFKINIPIFCFAYFFEDYFNTQVNTNKTVTESTVEYHPSPLK